MAVHRTSSQDAHHDGAPQPGGTQAAAGYGRVPFVESSLTEELKETLEPLKSLLLVDDDPFRGYRHKTWPQRAKLWLFNTVPLFNWLANYRLSYLVGDVVGGLTIASLAVPQVRSMPRAITVAHSGGKSAEEPW